MATIRATRAWPAYLKIGKDEGANVLVGGEACELGGDLADGWYIQPTVFAGSNDMRIFQEEIFGPVLATTSFTDFDEAMRIANDTDYGLGAGVWTRDQKTPSTGQAAPFRLAVSGSTTTIITRPTPLSVATRSQASAARPT